MAPKRPSLIEQILLWLSALVVVVGLALLLSSVALLINSRNLSDRSALTAWAVSAAAAGLESVTAGAQSVDHPAARNAR